MDVTTLGAAIAIAKTLPDTAAGRAEAAAQAAAASAASAAEHNMTITIEDGIMKIEEFGGE